MALIKRTESGQEISGNAVACPPSNFWQFPESVGGSPAASLAADSLLIQRSVIIDASFGCAE
jgi:hypothetical protein